MNIKNLQITNCTNYILNPYTCVLNFINLSKSYHIYHKLSENVLPNMLKEKQFCNYKRCRDWFYERSKEGYYMKKTHKY